MAKVNSLQDPDICQALYRASQAGVKVHAQRPRHLLPAAGRARASRRTSRSARSSTASWNTPGSSTSATAATRRSTCQQRRLDAPQPRQAAGDPLPGDRPRPPPAADRRARDATSPTTSRPGACCPTAPTSRCAARARASAPRRSSTSDAVEAVRAAEQTDRQFQPLTRPKE